jgi:hypothetical protein
MAKRSKYKARLSTDVQLALGAELRARFGSWANRLPWPLMRLAQQVSLPRQETRGGQPRDPPAHSFDHNVFDPATIAALDEAFRLAWDDLQKVGHPATEDDLARCLARLVQVERVPARLATKAVIQLIVPQKN